MNGGLSMCKTQIDDVFLCCMSELHVDRVDRGAFVTDLKLEKAWNLLTVSTGWDGRGIH